MSVITGDPDEWRAPSSAIRKYAGPNWLASISEASISASSVAQQHYVIDLSNVGFITLSAWVGMVAMIERLMANPLTNSVGIDLKGQNDVRLLTRSEYLETHARKNDLKDDSVQASEYFQARRMYNVSGFIESLGTLAALSRPGRGSQAAYTWLGERGAQLKAFATRPDGKQTIVMPLMRIETKEHCKQFLEPDKIVIWREAMGDRFRSSPLFESEELWRIFCHEISVNIFEHANAAGFLAARVIEQEDLALPWCIMSYPPEVQGLFPLMSSGFLELCVSDGGQGFAATLERACRRQACLKAGDAVSPDEILQFAFDEVGTCKKERESWATERHALGRILQIVAKYGGALMLKSSGAEVIYASRGGAFERLPNHLGYRAQRKSRTGMRYGSHLQLILPLVPFVQNEKEDWRRSILISSLPSGFHTDPGHVRGHLVPVFEALDAQEACVGIKELLAFQRKCEALAQKLIEQRPPLEPIILDFGNLNWTPAQFETLLHLLQNVLQNRPVLFVEIAHSLAREVVEMEREGPTTLTSQLADKTPSVTGRAFGELSETDFLETYHRVHATVLALDIHGNPHIFGLKHRWCEPLLLSLIEKPQTLETLFRGRTMEETRVLKAILNNMNPLFYVEKDGRWCTVWSKQDLAHAALRVMSRHFDIIAERCHAWRGRLAPLPENGSGVETEATTPRDTKPMTFNLPWQDEWVCEFFESSRILSRQRYADEAGQRLVFRLEKGLQSNGKGLDEVFVLACVTAPAILLAIALHRWWPFERRPAIADLGPYVMLDPDGPLPAIASSSGIVVIQDVLDRGRVSNRLVELLQQQKREVLGVLSLARLVDDPLEVGVTAVNEGWQQSVENPAAIKSHALVNLLRPERCPPSDHNDPSAYWVEPRTLRPFRYSTLRRELKPKETQRNRLRPFFAPKQEGIICAGHYVYGERHFTVALDIKRAVDGEIGAEISAWLADLCQGVGNRSVDWESERGRSLVGDVTAVLVPLHSQIHYLWPRVERLLAQRGRRQMMWLLDATLFLGHGPAYRLPLQFDQQIRMAMRAQMTLHRSGKLFKDSGLRLLILDDAMVSARTAETILAEIDRAVSKACEASGLAGAGISPIEWIRYFTIFDQMNHAKHQHWHSLREVGSERSVPFVFEEYRPILGVPSYEAVNCPYCADGRRTKRLVAAAERHSAEVALAWASEHLRALQPIAIDSPGFQKHPSVRLPSAIDLLARKTPPRQPDKYQVWNTDEAILRFYELMYMSYPPSDVLPALLAPNAWAADGEEAQIVAEYTRFRWAVFEWCFRNWPRLIADSARRAFFECINAEIEAETSIVESLFEGLSRQRNDDFVKKCVVSAVNDLATLEAARWKTEADGQSNGDRRILLLENALTIFLLGIPQDELVTFMVKVNEVSMRLIDLLANLGASQTKRGLTFIRHLYLCFSRPRRADPAWALQVLAENLFRGRDPKDAVGGSHRLLPKLLSELDLGTSTPPDRRLLLSSLSLFLAGLDDLALFAADNAIPFREVRALGEAVIDWLKTHPDGGEPPRCVTDLLDSLSPEQELNPTTNFYRPFSDIFHLAVEELEALLNPSVKEAKTKNPGFTFEFEPNDVGQLCVLTPVHRLSGFLTNWAVDRALKPSESPRSRIEVHRHPMPVGTDNLRFRILTNFEPLQTTEDRTVHGPNYNVEVRTMAMFGGKLPDHWDTPSEAEKKEGFTAAYEFLLPTGFTPRRTL